MNHYLINGITENWQIAFTNNPPVWGFTNKNKSNWDALQTGDIIYFYASGIARGIIGKGVVLNKFHGDNPLWSEELKSGYAKWQLRFYFDPVTLLNPKNWKAGNGPIPCSDFNISGIGLQGKQILPLQGEQINIIEEAILSWQSAVIINSAYPENRISPLGIVSESKNDYNPHSELIKIIEDMGKLQNFYPQKEFSIPAENRRVDVIWRRELRGTPTYAFEIELSGGVDRALNKLFRCYQLWSTLPRLILPSEEHEKTEKISASLGFKEKVVLIEPEIIKKIYDRKKSFKDLEKEIGLL